MTDKNYSAQNLYELAEQRENEHIISKYVGILEGMYAAANIGTYWYRLYAPPENDLLIWLVKHGYKIYARDRQGNTEAVHCPADIPLHYEVFTIRWDTID